MKRIMLAAALVGAAFSIPASPVFAQPAFAVGKPLPEGTLSPGTVTVRVVAGGAASPVVGADATLLVNGAPRVARTDSAGRATFAGVPIGATVQAKIVDAEGKDQLSEPFPVPTAGGVRVMLTTKPFPAAAADASGMPPHGGAGGAGAPMPEARSMSGQPRADREVRPGAYQVRLTYNNLEIKDRTATDSEPPVGEAVTLVGYNADNGVDVHVGKVNAAGHALFEGLDVSGSFVYFALARLPRAGGTDRLMSVPVQLDPQVGSKVILSGDKRGATTPPIDDLANPQVAATPAGKVRVTLDGVPEELTEIVLIDAATRKVVARGKPVQSPPDPANVQAGARFEADASLPPGTLSIVAHGGAGGADRPMAEIAIRVIPADAPQTAAGLASKTGTDGTVRMAVAPDKQHRVVFTVNGKEFASEPLDLAKSGGKLDLAAQWEARGRTEVLFDVPYQHDHVLYAETTTSDKQLYRSMPFQTVETNGTQVSIAVLPRLLFRFNWQSFVEDQLLAVRGMFFVDNNSWIPYRGGPDGLLIPLPRDFKGGVVGDEFQREVAVAPGEGLRVLRPLPPGRKQFEAGFTLVADEGRVSWALDLPLGAFQSALHVRNLPGLKVNHPSGVTGQMRTAPNGQLWYAIDDIMIQRGQSMVMTVTGLPRHASWKKWLPRLVGLLAVATMLGGLGFALIRKRSELVPDVAARRAALMEELVELERSGKDTKRKEQVIAELERLWD